MSWSVERSKGCSRILILAIIVLSLSPASDNRITSANVIPPAGGGGSFPDCGQYSSRGSAPIIVIRPVCGGGHFWGAICVAAGVGVGLVSVCAKRLETI